MHYFQVPHFENAGFFDISTKKLVNNLSCETFIDFIENSVTVRFSTFLFVKYKGFDSIGLQCEKTLKMNLLRFSHELW